MRDADSTRRPLVILAFVGVFSLALFVLFLIFPNEISELESAQANTFSRSAVGHRAALELLEGLGLPVKVIRFKTESAAGEASLLILAEPPLGSEEKTVVLDSQVHDDSRGSADAGASTLESPLAKLLGAADSVLLVLPKRHAVASRSKPSELEFSSLLDPQSLGRMVQRLGLGQGVVRSPMAPEWTLNSYDVTPVLTDPQWLTSTELTPHVAQGDRILVGTMNWNGAQLTVVSDPDVLETHGLQVSENATFFARLVSESRVNDGPVLFDETLHGFEVSPNIWKELLHFPLLPVVLQVLLMCALWVWAGTGRFGTPVPVREELPRGKTFLIDNTADLLGYAGFVSEALTRYWRNTRDHVASSVHVTGALDGPRVVEALDRLARAKGLPDTASKLEHEVQGAAASGRVPKILDSARRIHRFRRRMLHGS